MQRTRREWVNDTVLLALVIVASILYFILNTPHEVVNVLKTFIDNGIPRLPVFTVVYIAFLPWFWGVVVYSWFCNVSWHRLAYSVIIVNLVASVVYLMFQTYVPRDVIVSNDIFSNLLRFIYSSDSAYSAFPSLHSALSATIATYFVIRKSNWSVAAVIMAVMVILSTLFVKQHFVLDAISGVGLGVITTYFVFRFLPEQTKEQQ